MADSRLGVSGGAESAESVDSIGGIQAGRLNPWRLSVAPMMDWGDRHCRYFHRQLTRHTRLHTEMVTTGAPMHGLAQCARSAGSLLLSCSTSGCIGGSEGKHHLRKSTRHRAQRRLAESIATMDTEPVLHGDSGSTLKAGGGSSVFRARQLDHS